MTRVPMEALKTINESYRLAHDWTARIVELLNGVNHRLRTGEISLSQAEAERAELERENQRVEEFMNLVRKHEEEIKKKYCKSRK